MWTRPAKQFPQPPVQNKQSKPVDIFNLAIKHFLLNRGEIYCNDQQLPLDAELHDLDARIQFSSLSRNTTDSELPSGRYSSATSTPYSTI
jgi:hypothetical protein